MAVAIARHRQRVDRIELIAGGHQGADQQASVDLDTDDHLGRVLGVLGDEGVEPGHVLDPVGHPSPAHHLPGLVDNTGIVVGLGPVHPNEDHRRPPRSSHV